jgi:hypothetical protein
MTRLRTVPETTDKDPRAEYLHPEWCDLTWCRPEPDLGQPQGTHESAGTLWPIQSGEADFTVRLVHSDDLGRDGKGEGETRLHLWLRQHAWGDDRDGDLVVEAGCSVADARALAHLLTKYADLAERTSRRDFLEVGTFATRDLP